MKLKQDTTRAPTRSIDRRLREILRKITGPDWLTVDIDGAPTAVVREVDLWYAVRELEKEMEE